MSFIDDSNQNIEKYNSSFKGKKKPVPLLKETSLAGAAGGFVGSSGTEVDSLFSGGFHPDYGELIMLLKKQIEHRKKIRKAIKDNEGQYGGESPLGGYLDPNTDMAARTYEILYAIIDARIKFNKEHTPKLDLRWKATTWDYEFDKIMSYIEEEDFINTSETNMQSVGIDTNYDKFDTSMGRNRRNRMFDKESETNIEHVIDELEPSLDKEDFIEKSTVNMEHIVKEEEPQLNEKDFINTSETNMKHIIDDEEELQLNEKDFINKSGINIEYIIDEEEPQLSEKDFINTSETNLKTIYKNDISLSVNIGDKQ